MFVRFIFALTLVSNIALAELPEVPTEASDFSLSDGGKVKKSPFIAGLYSSAWAGGGQFYLGEHWRGALYSLDNIAVSAWKFRDVKNNSERSLRTSSNIVSGNFFFGYQAYEAFVTARKDWDQELVLDTQAYSLQDLAASPFKKTSYNTWRVWVPLLLPSVVVIQSATSVHANAKLERSLYQIPAIFLASYLIGIGEEALFRGFQQPLFAQATGSKFWGNFLQSVSFGSCHTNWKVCNFPYITGHAASVMADNSYFSRQRPPSAEDRDLDRFVVTSLYGLYAGFMHQNQAFGLQKAITLHFLWDALVLTADYMENGSSVPIFVSFGSDF